MNNEMRGSASVSNSLEQIAHIVHEQGYWRPHERVQNYHRQDVYQLGKSAQRLFDDSQVLALAAKSLPGEHHEGSRLTGERR